MQAALHASTSATPMSRTALALQLTLRSELPVPLHVFQQVLELQAGLQHSDKYFSGPQPPFTVPARATHLSLWSVTLDTAQAAASVAQLVTLLHLAYEVPSSAVSALPLVALDAAGHPMQDALAPAQHLPDAAAQLCLHSYGASPDAGAAEHVKHKRLASEAASDLPPIETLARLAGAAPAAAVCSFTHKLTLELSTFAATAALQQSAGGVTGMGEQLPAPSIAFMGPMRLAAGQDASLMWRIRWPAAGTDEAGGAVPMCSACMFGFEPPPGKRPSGFDDDA